MGDVFTLGRGTGPPGRAADGAAGESARMRQLLDGFELQSEQVNAMLASMGTRAASSGGDGESRRAAGGGNEARATAEADVHMRAMVSALRMADEQLPRASPHRPGPTHGA